MQLFEEASAYEETEEESCENSKVDKGNEDCEEGRVGIGQLSYTFIHSISTGGEFSKEKLDDYDDAGFMTVLNEIF